MSVFGLINAERASFSVPLMCCILGVSRGGYYTWKGRPPSRTESTDASLTEQIHRIHERSRRTYGYPRVHAELRAIGMCCGSKRVARLMRKAGLKGCLRHPRRKRTTRRDGSAMPTPALLAFMEKPNLMKTFLKPLLPLRLRLRLAMTTCTDDAMWVMNIAKPGERSKTIASA